MRTGFGGGEETIAAWVFSERRTKAKVRRRPTQDPMLNVLIAKNSNFAPFGIHAAKRISDLFRISDDDRAKMVAANPALGGGQGALKRDGLRLIRKIHVFIPRKPVKIKRSVASHER